MSAAADLDLDRVLVSCLMPALPDPARLEAFRRSVADYCRQTHPRRELVVVLDRGDPVARESMLAHLASLARDDVRVVEPADKLTLGALRNVSVARARGEILCHWDDDDWFHPDRVRAELAELSRTGAQALVLEDVLLYAPAERTLRWTNWRATEPKGLPATLMVRREAALRYPEIGPESCRHEDTAAIRVLQARGGYRTMAGAAYLYVYVSHATNTSGAAHLGMLARELAISRTLLARREAELRDRLRAFDFGPGAVTVCGYNGVAFTIPGASDAGALAPAGSSTR